MYAATHIVTTATKESAEFQETCILLALFTISDFKAINSKLYKDISSSIESIIRGDPNGPYVALAIDVFGHGFHIWEPYINGQGMVRLLISQSGLVHEESIKNLKVVSAARKALANIAAVSASLLISTLSFDIIHSKNLSQGVACLNLIVNLVSKVKICDLAAYPNLSIYIKNN